MPVWQFVTCTAAGDDLADLPASSRSVSWRLDGPAEAQFRLDGRHHTAGYVDEVRTDLKVFRDGSLMFRGRIGPSDDEITVADHSASFKAADYRELLHRRLLHADYTWNGLDQALIAWHLVNTAQTEPGGNWGITRGSGQTTGVTRDRVYEDGANIGELLDNLGRVENGFDWEIDPFLRLNIWPQRGTQREWVAELGSTLDMVKRTVDPSSYANVVHSTGADGLEPVTAVASDIGTRPEGRFELSIGDPDVVLQATVGERARGELARAQVLLPSYTGALSPGRWTPGDAWIGDAVQLVVQSGRLNVDTVERVEEITVTVDDEGAESVSVNFGHERAHVLRQLKAMSGRLTNLERR